MPSITVDKRACACVELVVQAAGAGKEEEMMPGRRRVAPSAERRKLRSRARDSSRADDSGPRAGSSKGDFVSSSLETVGWFSCEASSSSDARLSRLEMFLPELLFCRQQFVCPPGNQVWCENRAFLFGIL